MVQRAFPMRVAVGLALAIVLIAGVVVAGDVLRDDDRATSAPPDSTTSSSASSTTTTTTLPPTTTTTAPPIPPLQQPPPAPELPVVPPGTLVGPGSDPMVVAAFKQRLHDLKFDPGPVDGNYGREMMYAVEALQKIHGLDPNGRIGSLERDLLVAWQHPPPLHHGAELDRTEIDVAKQVITLYKGNQVALITTTSTASGETFCYVTPKKAPTQRICEVATTPNGRYEYYFFYNGWQDGDLGELYNPYYFFKGRAIHGYESVPTHPASHGCARIPMHIATYWHTLVSNGEAVYVDGSPYDSEQIISSQPI